MHIYAHPRDVRCVSCIHHSYVPSIAAFSVSLSNPTDRPLGPCIQLTRTSYHTPYFIHGQQCGTHVVDKIFKGVITRKVKVSRMTMFLPTSSFVCICHPGQDKRNIMFSASRPFNSSSIPTLRGLRLP